MSARIVRALIVVAVAVVAAALWRFTPLYDVRTVDDVDRLLASVAASPLLPLYLLAAFVVAGALFVSVWLVIAQTCLLLPPVAAVPLALLGACTSACLFYGVGRLLGRDVVERFAPRRVQDAVAGAGLQAVIAVRLVPLLPYTFVNLCCGAFGVRFRVFVAGTILGMAPGIVGLAILGESLLAVIRHPSPAAIAGLCAAVVIVVTLVVAARRRARRRIPSV